MNSDLVFEILELGVSLVREVATNNSKDNLSLEETLIELAQRTDQAYEDHTGQPLDPSLIRNEDPIH